jgi:integrase
MKKKDLTAKRVKALKPEEGRRFALDVPDGHVQGLNLVVHPTGRKSWAFRYRFEGKQKRITFEKRYPELSLGEARAEARGYLERLERGEDPAAATTIEESKPDPTLTRVVIAEYLARYVRPRARTAREIGRVLEREAVDRWGGLPVSNIGRADLLRALDGIVDRGSEAMANKTLRVLRRFFSWCVERGYIEASPAAGLKAPSVERSRDRVLTEEELGEVWRASGELGYPNEPLVRLLILTAQRRGEVASMRWRDVDLNAGLWTLPREAVKSGRVHDVPLSPPVVALLAGLPRFTKGDYVLTTTSGEKAVNGFSKAKARIDAEILKAREEAAAGAKVKPPPGWTMHDLRRSAATHMAKANVAPHVLAALLNHSPGRTLGISAVYIRHRYQEERRAALEAWAEHVLALVESVEQREAV